MAKLKDMGWYIPKKGEGTTTGMTSSNKLPSSMTNKSSEKDKKGKE